MVKTQKIDLEKLCEEHPTLKSLIDRSTWFTSIQIEDIILSYELCNGNASQASETLKVSQVTIRKYWGVVGLESKGKSRNPGRPRAKKTTIDSIITMHVICEGNASEASRRLGVCRDTVAKHWKNAGLPVEGARPYRGIKHSLEAKQIKEVIKAHSTYDGNATEASKHLPHSRQTITKYWEANGLSHNNHRKLSDEQIDLVAKAYELFDGNASEAARNLSISLPTILKYWKSEGLSTEIKLDQDQIDRIVEAYKLYNGNASRAAEELEHSNSTIYKYWIANGLSAKGNYRPRLNMSVVEKVVSSYDRFNGNAAAVADHFFISKSSVIRYWKKAKLQAKGHQSHRKKFTF